MFDKKWTRRFLETADHFSKWSKDPSSQVGCVLVGPDKEILSIGYNGFPRGVNDDVPSRWDRPQKYELVIHAETNAILNASRNGTKVHGSIAYCTHIPCSRCVGQMIQAGISRVVCYEPNSDWRSRYAENIAIAEQMLREARIRLSTRSREVE